MFPTFCKEPEHPPHAMDYECVISGIRGYSSVVRAADSRSAGPWFKSSHCFYLVFQLDGIHTCSPFLFLSLCIISFRACACTSVISASQRRRCSSTTSWAQQRNIRVLQSQVMLRQHPFAELHMSLRCHDVDVASNICLHPLARPPGCTTCPTQARRAHHNNLDSSTINHIQTLLVHGAT